MTQVPAMATRGSKWFFSSRLLVATLIDGVSTGKLRNVDRKFDSERCWRKCSTRTWTEGLRVIGMTSRLASSQVTCSVSSSQRQPTGQKASTRPAATSKMARTSKAKAHSLISLVATEASVFCLSCNRYIRHHL